MFYNYFFKNFFNTLQHINQSCALILILIFISLILSVQCYISMLMLTIGIWFIIQFNADNYKYIILFFILMPSYLFFYILNPRCNYTIIYFWYWSFYFTFQLKELLTFLLLAWLADYWYNSFSSTIYGANHVTPSYGQLWPLVSTKSHVPVVWLHWTNSKDCRRKQLS